MIRPSLPAVALVAALPWPGLAQEAVGDPAAGEAEFAQHCVECHVLETDAGEILAGRTPSGAPNLFGVAGRVPGSIPGFFYSPPMRAYGKAGAVWEEEGFVAYVQDPTGFLTAQTAGPGRGRMPAGLVADERAARDLWAYLAALPSE